jgi:hypothetical protein
MLNSHCYNFILRTYDKGLFDNFVDATYILTMINSDRHKNIEEQLYKYIPTKKIYIGYNKGYKNCNKKLHKKIPPYDISDFYFNTINHAINNNYGNILILEDDFIFSENIKNSNIIKEINLFFNNNINRTFYYNIGALPLFFYPKINFRNNTYRGYFCFGAQSIIYTKKLQHEILKYKESKDVLHWDIFISSKFENYFYKTPLCYQLFNKTENELYWFYGIKNNTIKNLVIKCKNKFIEDTQLDKTPHFGFYMLYKILFLLHYLFIFIFMLVIILLYYIFKK